MKKINVYYFIVFLPIVFFFFGSSVYVFADDELTRPEGTTCEVNGITIDCDDPAIETGPNCNPLHYHGNLNGVADPDPEGCGHGLVLSVAPKEETSSTWNKITDWLDVFFQGLTGGFSPKTVSDTVDIVEDASPSLKETTDNAGEYFKAYPDAPGRDRYTLKDENPEENAIASSLYRWFWGLFE